MRRYTENKPSQGVPLSRRDFAALAGGAGAAFAMGFPVRAMAQTPPVQLPAQFAESPLFAEQTASGALPPVRERLPLNPMIVTPTEQVGKYGGSWRTAIVGGGDFAWLVRTVAYDYLVRWDPAWEAVVPNVAESWETSADGRTYTFKLREGHKWSDGQPFTVADVMFYGEDVYRNEELTTSLGTNPWTIEQVDDLRFAVTFERPDGLFIQNLATPNGDDWTGYPKHYLQQFHAKYNTTNLDQLVADAGTETWARLFQQMGTAIPGTSSDARFQNLELPTLYGWRLVEPYAEGTRVRVERNPYYFKVDPEGNQLPYIDEVVFNTVQDNEVLLLQATNGELDMHARHINTDPNKSVLSQAAADGGFRLFEMLLASMNTCMIAFNMTSQDPALQPIFANKDFRVGLSHAINRQEIIDAVFVGQGEPWQGAPRPESAYVNETLAKQFTEYSVDLANQHLDKVLPDKDGSGMRLRPDGQALVIRVDVTSLEPTWVDQMNLVIGYWQQVGVQAQLQPQDRSLLYQRKDANQHECVVWGGDGGLNDAILEMRWYAPVNNESNYGIGWWQWFAQPANPLAAAVEPPAEVQEQLKLVTQLRETVDPVAQGELFQQILDIAAEQFYAIGIALPGPGYGIVKTNFRNLVEPMPNAYLYPHPGPSNPEQYFFES
ncbi:MAG: ABC transporter, substrate-binding protein (cluster 5, nickel/peptides/opines) [uncultured Thermomicrobiales bacterium]|uniref:ABC transporter, substrate-binding protein (Cluster 5, nickel/peptides/opines) n=1 Tax=uncultured Thermomicrobiales bacterium TaxID=1645740 RepID=A0A6J4ULH6_9BACT|nr:MAG: ABC transporter, substrate-binding protein (cluster 5, nickel/peptides/opines) [uncultured Thermomicrobiales bacterium]